MNQRNFDTWFSTFRKSINSYGYYTDFSKIYENAEALKVEINILNSLVGSSDIEDEFVRILQKYPECLKVIPLLLAVRENEIYCQDENGEFNYRFDRMILSVDQYCYFMKQTGLFDMLQHHIISNLYDYVTGVNVGLDSNARKNRGGDQMEDLVERYILKTGVKYYKEMTTYDIRQNWGLDLSAITADGTSSKRFDFVVNAKNNIYGIETNFYTSSGSKLNETARSYKMLAEESKNVAGFTFIWITDGHGWKSARRNLKETFDVMEHLYNIHDLEQGILDHLFI